LVISSEVTGAGDYQLFLDLMVQTIQGVCSSNMRKYFVQGIALLICACGLAGYCAAQANTEFAAQSDLGWTSYVQFGGTTNSDGQIFLVQPSVGYTFTQHFGIDVGLPLYFVHASSANTGGVSGSGVGNPSVDLRWKFLNPKLNYGSVLTGSAPLGDSKLGLSTGRATFDWNNRIDRSFNRVTPFLEGGLSNTVSDTRLFVRPYTTLGMNAHFLAGANVEAWDRVSIGASAYDIAPFGNQTVFSRVTGPSNNGPAATHGRNFQSTQQTSGSASIAKDSGFSTFLRFTPNQYVDAELGYTRSVHFDLNSISFSLGFNVGRLLRNSN